MKVYLVSFATPNFYKSQKKLNKTALQFGVDECIPFTDVDLKKTDFYQENKLILDQERGAGYWLWKPFIILEAMKQADEGDIVIYSDSGAEVIESLQPLLDICRKQEGLLFFRVPFFSEKLINKNWTKRDCFILMDADTDRFHSAGQVAGSPHFYLKNKKNIAFIRDWLSYCKDARILTDQPNSCGSRNYPEFIDHRHDQSVLSILAVKNNLEIFRDPSQYADHLKMEPFRKKGELPHGVDYSPTPFLNSPYGTIFNLHRERNFSISHKFSKVVNKLKTKDRVLTRPSQQLALPRITIGITTFESRFEKYFMPLLSTIRGYDHETEIIVAVNGEHDHEFNEGYRADILRYLSSQKKVFPVMFPLFRGVSKLWNTIIIHATHDFILVLNDDIMITDKNFIGNIQELILKNNEKSFTINESWSHFLISREEIDHLGYFDERFLGIGEEDGDISWRYFQEYRRPISDFRVRSFKNFAEETVHTYKPTNITCHSGTKYSQFNRDFVHLKYREGRYGLPGMFGKPVIMVDAGPDQYPNEKFYRKRKNEL